MQRMPYGRIEHLSIKNGDPVFSPPARFVRDIKLGSAESGPRPELESADFLLKREHIELFDTFSRIADGLIDCIEIKAGLPFRITVEQKFT
jgi:hypothetical protein